MRCEDFPCCGHTYDDPCEPQWYDAPGAFDTSRPGNKHALCEHADGFCAVDPFDSDYAGYADEEDEDDFVMEDQWLDSYMEDRISGMYGE